MSLLNSRATTPLNEPLCNSLISSWISEARRTEAPETLAISSLRPISSPCCSQVFLFAVRCEGTPARSSSACPKVLTLINSMTFFTSYPQTTQFSRHLKCLVIFAGHQSHAELAKNSFPLLTRSEEHTSELQSLRHLVCRLLLEKKS